jgi:hypothetical protein
MLMSIELIDLNSLFQNIPVFTLVAFLEAKAGPRDQYEVTGRVPVTSSYPEA